MNFMTKDYNLKMADSKRVKETEEKKNEEKLDINNINDAENTRKKAYKFMKDTISQMKKAIK